jgi:hypothetical protein
MHTIGVPEGVTLLEFKGLNLEDHPPTGEQVLNFGLSCQIENSILYSQI